MGTLSLTRVSSGATIASSTENANQAAIEAVVNGGIEAANLAADAVTAAKVNSDVVNADNGLKQETDGSLSVDPSDTNPCLEISDGGVRVVVDDITIERASGGIQVKDGSITPDKLEYKPIAINGIYINVSGTDPATELGYGTWSAFGAGKVLVGYDSEDTDFDTAEETGGEKTHLLTGAESGTSEHTHKETVYGTTGGSKKGVEQTTNFHNTGIESGHSTLASAEADASEAHNNLQPYIVVHFWKRTA